MTYVEDVDVVAVVVAVVNEQKRILAHRIIIRLNAEWKENK